MMDEPPVRYWLMGANEWHRPGLARPKPSGRSSTCHWEGLTTEEPRPTKQLGASALEPDVFTQMPVTRTTRSSGCAMTEPLAHDVTVAGPISLTRTP